ncbi:hypothetical protein C6495_16880 [Candidatus Poribacteria bacterium]|nr:MAG: hypothetical protein C6495_16880 [Candidatus Poribacteria bacterium]
MRTYGELVTDITRDVRRLRGEYGRLPCPADCFDCCKNTATMAISEVEARALQEGLDALPPEIRAHIHQKAERTISRLEALGYDVVNATPESGMTVLETIRGTPEAECPMLIGGVCAVYEHRPVICRVWGYPLDNGRELACCHKTFIGRRRDYKPLNYAHYWRQCRALSEALGAARKTPNCYVVRSLLASASSRKN